MLMRAMLDKLADKSFAEKLVSVRALQMLSALLGRPVSILKRPVRR